MKFISQKGSKHERKYVKTARKPKLKCVINDSAIESIDRPMYKEVTDTVGFDLFRLKKLNNRNFYDIVLNMNSKQ